MAGAPAGKAPPGMGGSKLIPLNDDQWGQRKAFQAEGTGCDGSGHETEIECIHRPTKFSAVWVEGRV